jgi:hypothetical protein
MGMEGQTAAGLGYQITIRGKLDKAWADWFDGLTIAYEASGDGATVTTLTGAVADQAALRGILHKLWDLNMVLISILPIEEIE